MKKFLLTVATILLSSAITISQSQSTTGNIEGRVADPNGAVVPGVTITATNQDTGFSKSTTSDQDGNFILPLLPSGKYKITVGAASGFAGATYENVVVTVGAKTALNIDLRAGGAVGVVDVSGEGQGVELTRTSVSSTVDETKVINLPTNGRNFLDFATLAPGVVRDPTRAGDLAIGGQKGTFNSVQMDGTSSDNTFFGQSSGRVGSGRAPSEFSVDTVKEFQVNTNGFSAEYGRAAGGVINAITKSGTNSFSGSAYEYFRDESLDARNPNLVAIRRHRPAGQINQFGGTFGGPFKKDKAFFFGAYEGQRSNLPNPVILASLPFAQANVQSFLGPKAASYSVDRAQDTYLIKTDFNINQKNLLWVRFNQQNFKGTNLENGGALSALEHTGNSNVTTSTISANLTTTIRPTWINEFRYQYSRDREPGLSNSSDPEATVLASAGGITDGTFNWGRNNFRPRETTINRNQFIDNQTLIRGNHTVKYGADLLFDQIFNFFPGLFSGSYTFANYTALSNQLATPGTQFATEFKQSFAGPGTTGGTTNPNNREYGFFVQDDWRVTPKLTINPGLRYDYQSIAKPPIQNPNAALLAAGFDTSFRPSDKNNFGPRIGVSYALSQKSVIRAGYGVYYGRTPAILTGTAHSQNGIQVIAIDVFCQNPGAVCPLYPNVFASPPVGASLAPINLYLFSKNYKQPFTHQARVQYERELWKNTTFSVQYQFYRGVDLTRTRDANLAAPIPTIVPVLDATGATTGQTLTVMRFPSARVISGFNRISLFESTARSLYQGFGVRLNRRFSKHWQFDASYTLSKAKDDKPDQTSVVVGADDSKVAEDQFDLSGEYGTSDLDMRHRFVAGWVYDTGKFTASENKFVQYLLSDYVLTGIFQANSGVSYSAVVSGDPNNDGNRSNDRAPDTVRNQFHTPAAYIFDLRAGRGFHIGERAKIQVFAEGFNLFNRANVIAVNNTKYAFSGGALKLQSNFQTPRLFYSGSPGFSLNNSSYNREFQLGIRLDF